MVQKVTRALKFGAIYFRMVVMKEPVCIKTECTHPKGFGFVNLILLGHALFDELAKIIKSKAGTDLDLILLHFLLLFCLRDFFLGRGAKRTYF